MLYRTDVANKLDADAIVLQLLAVLDTDLDLSNQMNKQRCLGVRNIIIVSPREGIIQHLGNGPFLLQSRHQSIAGTFLSCPCRL